MDEEEIKKISDEGKVREFVTSRSTFLQKYILF